MKTGLGISIALCLVVLLNFPARLEAATYYVNPSGSCSNTNAGSDPSLPWCTPPGTRTTSDSGFLSSAWGPITTSAKVQCGDTILLRGGATQTSAKGGGWRIDNGPNENGAGYYSLNCSSSTPITIRVATGTEWSGSSGPFILDGTGTTATCLRFCGSGGFGGLIHIQDVDTLIIGGSSAAQRLIVRNGTSAAQESNGIMATGSSGGSDNTVRRLRVQWVELSNNQRAGFMTGSVVRDWLLYEWISHDNGAGWVEIGAALDHPSYTGGMVNGEAYRNGTRATDCAGSGEGLFTGVRSLWIVNTKVHDERCSAFNAGAISNLVTDQYWDTRIRGFYSWNNGTLVSNGSARAGLQMSGDETSPTIDVRVWLFRAIFYNNGGPGLYYGHGGGMMNAWNVVSFRNGEDEVRYNRAARQVSLQNSILVRRGQNLWGSTDSCCEFDFRPVSDYNLYDFQSGGSETLTNFSHNGSFSYTARTFDGSSSAGFFGANDRISTTSGRRYNASFASLGGNCDTATRAYQDCNFTVQSTSDAIDAGKFFMTATAAGSGATTINVSTDPRNYFIEPASFYQAGLVTSGDVGRGDTIQIQGCGRVEVTSMSANSISFTPACSWSSGAGVHLPWNGTRPDLGAFEAGGVAAPTAPQNLRILP